MSARLGPRARAVHGMAMHYSLDGVERAAALLGLEVPPATGVFSFERYAATTLLAWRIAWNIGEPELAPVVADDAAREILRNPLSGASSKALV